MPDYMTALRNAHNAGDEEAARRIAAMIKAQNAGAVEETAPVQSSATPAQGQPEQPGMLDKVAAGAAEFASGVNRSVLGGVDFFLQPIVNAGAMALGSDFRMPDMQDVVPGAEKKGAFLGEGLATDVLSTAGEMTALAAGAGAALRKGASMLSPLTEASESASKGLLRQAGKTTAVQDFVLGGASGVGMELGEEAGGDAGALAGSILVPVGVAGAGAAAKGALTKLFSSPQGVKALARNLSQVSEDGAATILADAMVKEGISPDDIAKRMQQLGPEAIPADVSTGFSNLLRASANKIPRIQGRANQVIAGRQAGQTDRLLGGMDDAAGLSGLTLDDEIARMNTVMKPRIDALYAQSRTNPVNLSDDLKVMLSGDSSLGKARKAANKRLLDKQALGEEVGDIEIIDATKQELDDQIGKLLRKGAKNKARDLVALKNKMLEEVDSQAPVYAEARNLFAGKAQLESASDLGTQFFKLKPRDVEAFTKSMGESETRMFRLGAKQAVMDKVDTLQTNADAVRRMFGKRGDVSKLKTLFDDDTAYQSFHDTLETEANFIATRNAVQGNSTTFKQAVQSDNAQEALEAANALTGNPLAAATVFGRLVRGFSTKRGSEEFTKSLEAAGDILLNAGTDPRKLERMIRGARVDELQKLLQPVLIKNSRAVLPSGRVATSQLALENNQQRQTGQ